LEKFEDPFFELIENCLETQGQSTSERIFFSLQPDIKCDDATIKKYTDFLNKIENQPKKESTERLIKWVKESIQSQQEKKKAREISRKWLDESKVAKKDVVAAPAQAAKAPTQQAAKPEVKQAVKPETKPEVKPEAKQVTKPESKQATKPTTPAKK